MEKSFEMTVSNLLKARFPLLYVNSWEEERIIERVVSIAKNIDLIKTTRNVFSWSITEGLLIEELNTDSKSGKPSDKENDPVNFLKFVENYDEAAIFIIKDFHALTGSERRNSDPAIIRKLRDLAVSLKVSTKPKSIIFISPVLSLPVELQKDITIVDFNLPNVDEIRNVLLSLVEANSSNQNIKINLSDSEIDILSRAAQGLTINEAENSLKTYKIFPDR